MSSKAPPQAYNFSVFAYSHPALNRRYASSSKMRSKTIVSKAKPLITNHLNVDHTHPLKSLRCVVP